MNPLRFEDLQMKIMEAAANHLEIYNIEVFLEQLTLQRENKLYLTLPGIEFPFSVIAIVSFVYDVMQTGLSIYEYNHSEKYQIDEGQDYNEEGSIDLDFYIRFPIMQGFPVVEKQELIKEIERNYPDTEAILISKDFDRSEVSSGKINKEFFKLNTQYEMTYFYEIDCKDVTDTELYEEIFEELSGILNLIYSRTKRYMDINFYENERGEDKFETH